MSKRGNERNYRIGFPPEQYSRMEAAAAIDGRTMKSFIIQACLEKTEKIEMESITRPWIPSGLKRTR